MSGYRVIWDATGVNLAGLAIPAGVGLALYVTGSGGVPATAAQLAAHPDAVRIDQSPADTPADELADVKDYEPGAATLASLPGWYRAAAVNYAEAKRPGQRWPGVYCSYSNRTEVVNEFVTAGIKSGPRLWLASWDAPVEQIIDALVNSGGPFPVIGWQLHNAGTHDVSLVRSDWLDDVSSPYPKNQRGVVVSYTTQGRRDVTSTDHGRTFG